MERNYSVLEGRHRHGATEKARKRDGASQLWFRERIFPPASGRGAGRSGHRLLSQPSSRGREASDCRGKKTDLSRVFASGMAWAPVGKGFVPDPRSAPSSEPWVCGELSFRSRRTLSGSRSLSAPLPFSERPASAPGALLAATPAPSRQFRLQEVCDRLWVVTGSVLPSPPTQLS